MATESYTFTPIGGSRQSFSSEAARDAAMRAHSARVREERKRARAAYTFRQAIEQYKPGGGYGKGVQTMLARKKAKAIAGGQQALISAGLGGTSQMAGLGKKFVEEVGAPAMGQVESERARAIANLRARYGGLQFGAAETEAARAGQYGQAGIQAAARQAGLQSQEAIAQSKLGLGYKQLELQTAIKKLTSAAKKDNLPKTHLDISNPYEKENKFYTVNG